ncbi:MAG: PKD domain-containing protein, partial [Thermoplasmata archaeon]|nr:PKD domain-containing protein [Thermoplasmata archaeon]
GGTYLGITTNGTYGGELGWTGNSSGSPSPGCVNQGGSGGGYAPFPRPWWQSAPGVPSSPSTRGAPDVAADASAPVEIYFGGSATAVAGTSASCPMWASVAVIADQAAHKDLGLLNPSLYAIARSANYAKALHDVKNGSNGYNATAGWDPVTGLGSMNFGFLVPLLAGGTLVPGSLLANLHATPRSGPVGLTVTFRVSATGGTGGYPMFDVSFGDGNANLAANGLVLHTYSVVGAYVARAVAFDSSGNSSVAPPLAVVVGGGSDLTVGLNVTPSAPATLTQVNFTASVSGGTPPYRFAFTYGDGAYLVNGTTLAVAHTYLSAGGYCPSVVVTDSAYPPDAGTSNRFALAVGGAATPGCENPAPLVANFTSSLVASDLPGDLPLHTTYSGGSGPSSIRYTSDDAYVGECSCGIFRTPGNHTVYAYVNDSVNQEVTASLPVTLYPSLFASFNASSLAGTVPLSVTFRASASGGHGADANRTLWSFGDGTSGSGSSVTHAYTSVGFYLAVADLMDQGHGNASEAFLIDVVGATAWPPSATVVSATIGPAIRFDSGSPVAFHAMVQGLNGPFQVRWQFGDNNSAFGAFANQTYSPALCRSDPACPLVIGLSVLDALGTFTNVTMPLSPAIARNGSGLTLADSLNVSGDLTPVHLSGVTATSTMSGTRVSWSFGDGGSVIGASATHTYLSPGNYTLYVEATDNAGDLLERTHALAITGPIRTLPNVTLDANPSRDWGIAPVTEVFSANASGGGGGPYAFAWQFGDNTSAVAAVLSHTYALPGNYTAVVTVTDSLGDSQNATFHLVVYNASRVSLNGSASPTSVAPGHSVGVSLRVQVNCTNASVPGCGPGGAVLGLWFVPRGAMPLTGSVPSTTAVADPAGVANVSVAAPGAVATYSLFVAPLSDNYTANSLVFLIEVHAVATPLLGITLDPLAILLVAGAFGAGLGLALVEWRRMGPKPPGPPAVSP